jgi:hypothetical protein
MTLCSNCNTEIEDLSKFCTQCGSPISVSGRRSAEMGLEKFWLRSWMAGEIGLAPHCYGESTSFRELIGRVQRQVSKSPKYRDFFAGFVPLDAEYCIKETCPSSGMIGTACPFPNGFTFLSTNRRIFHGTPPNINCITLSDIDTCELLSDGKTSTGIVITKHDKGTVTVQFDQLRSGNKPFKMPQRYAETFASRLLNRSQVARADSDLPALNAAMEEYEKNGKLKRNKAPVSGGAVLVGIAAGVFFFFASLRQIDSLGASLIIGAGAIWAGIWAAKNLSRG